MPAWLVTLLAPMLATGVGMALGGTKSKQTTSSTTDPFYALMSPYTIGNILQRMGALSGAGFPAGAMGSLGGLDLGKDIWGAIQKSWPDIMKGLKVGGGGNLTSLRKPV